MLGLIVLEIIRLLIAELAGFNRSMLPSDITEIVDRLEKLIDRKIEEARNPSPKPAPDPDRPRHWQPVDVYSGEKDDVRRAIENLIDHLQRG